MATDGPSDTFALVPTRWFEPVVGLWTLLVAVVGIELLLAGGEALFAPLGTRLWSALVVAVVVSALAYGGVGVGLAAVYRAARGFGPLLPDRSLDRGKRRWVGGLAVAALVAMGAGGVWSTLLGHSTGIVAPLFAVGAPPSPEGMGALQVPVPGYNEVVGAAPLVAVVALFGLLFTGPAVAAVFQGVLQDTLARVAHPAVSVGATALATTVVVEHSAFVSLLTVHEALHAVVAFAFALAVAVAYRETDSILVAMAGYGLFNALAVVGAWLSLLASLAAAGHLR